MAIFDIDRREEVGGQDRARVCRALMIACPLSSLIALLAAISEPCACEGGEGREDEVCSTPLDRWERAWARDTVDSGTFRTSGRRRSRSSE